MGVLERLLCDRPRYRVFCEGLVEFVEFLLHAGPLKQGSQLVSLAESLSHQLVLLNYLTYSISAKLHFSFCNPSLLVILKVKRDLTVCLHLLRLR